MLRVLHLEDVPSDAELVKHALFKGEGQYEIKLVDNKAAFIDALVNFEPDVVISDHSLPAFDSLGALNILQELNSSIPFILVTATISEEFAVGIIQQGADDYILKDRLQRLPSAINNAIEKKELEKERNKFIKELIEKEDLLKEAEHLAGFGSWREDVATGTVKWSDEVYNLLGYSKNEIEESGESFLRHIHPDDVKLVASLRHHAIEETSAKRTVFRIIDKNGNIKHISSELAVKRDETGKPIYMTGVLHDITREIAARHKMEAALTELNKVFNTIDEVVFSVDMVKFKINQMSPACVDVYGYTPDDFFTNDDLWRNLVLPEDAPIIVDQLAKINKGEVVNNSYRIKHKDGTIRWIENKVFPTLNDEGVLLRIDGITRDITQRKKAEEDLQKSEANLRTIFENTDNAYILLDTNMKVISFNHQAEFFTERDLLSVVKEGMNGIDLFAEPRKAFIKEVTLKVFKGENIQYEVSYPQANGGLVWYYIKMFPVSNNGNVIGLTMTIADISHRKKYESEIHALNESLEKKVLERTIELENTNKELESFSYSVSHDLRAPLRVINGLASILESKCSNNLTAETSSLLNEIRDNTKYMNQLIDDLLELSRSSMVEIKKRHTEMRPLVDVVLAELQLGIQHHADIEIGNLPSINCDKHLIKQVWTNLISNAVKYSSKKSNPTVNIGSFNKGGQVVYYVKDNGAGFNMCNADKLFGVFQRLHTKAEFNGTGVGLALVRRIVNRHGGQVWAEAVENEGATFYFSLPV